MIEFDSGQHTAEALASEIEVIYSIKPSVILAGSLGRSAAFSALTGDYTAGFEASNPIRRPDGSPRDIDLIEFPAETAVELGPFKADTNSFNSVVLSIDRQDGDWFLRSQLQSFEAPLHPAVMEPVSAEILGGVNTITLPPQTQLSLLGLRRMMRDKDAANYQRLQQAISESDSPLLPGELYKPFEDLKAIWREDFVVKLRHHYRAVVPAGIRQHLTPLHRAAMQVLWP